MVQQRLIILLLLCQFLGTAGQSQPNVILIITDDQGYGDFGFTGNPHVQTPVIDSLAKESIHLTQFYVSPVCAPTRSSLLTGRYSLRTGIRDTYNGGAIMATEEITLAELFKEKGYRTGQFGKWHLGDNYPSRPIDQGFDESLMHLAGGMGQVGDVTTYYQKNRSYFDPVLWKNGEPKDYQGYCSDIFTEAAIAFLKSDREEPFFCYLAYNAPHTPLQVPQKYLDKYAETNIDEGYPLYLEVPEMSDRNKEDARKVYAMVENIDENLGKLFSALQATGKSEETVIVFMTDNGPQQPRYTAGLRGRKGQVYEGGIKVPCLIKVPGVQAPTVDINVQLAHLDILPTLAEICNLKVPQDRVIDGLSFASLLSGNSTTSLWKERPLFSYWTRKYPEHYQNMALRQGDYKLVAFADFNAPLEQFELYNLANDPFEQSNIIETEPQIAQGLKAELDKHLDDVLQSPNLQDPPPIRIGYAKEKITLLNRNDAGGERGIWAQDEIYGHWLVDILPGTYNLEFHFHEEVAGGGKLLVEMGSQVLSKEVIQNTQTVLWEEVSLNGFHGLFIPTYTVKGKRIFPFYMVVTRQ